MTTQQKLKKLYRRITSSLFTKVLLRILFFIVLPLYLVLGIVQTGYENYLKEELSNRIVQTISKGEESIGLVFQKMANLSNILVFNEELTTALNNKDSSYYEATKAFDTVIANLSIVNLFDLNDTMITIFDSQGRLYSNWSAFYDDYYFLQYEDWVTRSVQQKGHIVWDFFSEAYRKDAPEGTKYISLARSILQSGVTGNYMGTVIISMQQDTLSNLLTQYTYDETDCIYICTDTGKVLFRYDEGQAISPDTLERAVQAGQGQSSGSTTLSAEKSRYLVSYYSLSQQWNVGGQALRVFHFTDYGGVERQLRQISGWVSICLLFSMVVILVVVLLVVRQVVEPIQLLAREMDSYSLDSAVGELDTQRQDEIGRVNRSYLAMTQKIQSLFQQLNQEFQIKERYRFEALRAQINPHFLFNTLNTIRWMSIIRKADNITQSINALSRMLHFSMDKSNDVVPLRTELEHIGDYVFIQNCRYGDCYEVSIQLAEELLDYRIIKFILQPVVENSIIHAFQERETGLICITGQVQEDVLMLYVRDNGVGMSPEMAQALLPPQTETPDTQRNAGKGLTGIGLRNVQERIRASYGASYGLTVTSQEGEGTVVTYRLPLIEGKVGYETIDGG